jgi:hypothetical protein
MEEPHQKLNMYERVAFRIRIQGGLDESWGEYFGTTSTTQVRDSTGNAVTIIVSEPMDQSALVGLLNHLNALGLPLISIEPI